MPQSDLSPLTIVSYSRDFLIELVRLKTGWDERNEVSDKIQLNYLCGYLEDCLPKDETETNVSTKTILVEDEYIDRHYLEDYSEYYARCFSSHPKKCTRVHFFSCDFEEHQFREALTNGDKTFLSSLSDAYIGFVVIRPIPHTFLAKVCVRPYQELINNDNYKLITREHRVSLFGLCLTVTTAAFLEQDKVVSACATSALWMLFSSSFHKSLENLPSPSAITKSASLPTSEGGRTFPTSGLFPMQVAKSLKHFGLEPLMFSCSADNNSEDLKEIIHSYIGNDIPVLIGGSIYRKLDDGQIKYLGKHLICALGHHVQRHNYHEPKHRLLAHDVKTIYVHDDRIGPYVRIDTTPLSISVENEKVTGLEFSLFNGKIKEYIAPDFAIVGLYHKVRIPYIDIRNMCCALYSYVYEMSVIVNNYLNTNAEQDNEKDKRLFFQKAQAGIQRLITEPWDISLTTNTSVKEDILSNQNFITFNGASTKTSLLLKSMPKYIWRCRIWDNIQGKNKIFTDILFDATEVPQGQMLIGYVTYSLEADAIWRGIAEEANDPGAWRQYKVSQEAKKHISVFLRFFSRNKEKAYLNTLYGPLGLPRRKLKQGETDILSNIKNRGDIRIVRRGGNPDWSWLCKGIKYIWLIDYLGDLVIGEDIINDPAHGSQGHPTLINGKPARLGGELSYSENKGWIINLKSGTYSGHLKEGSDESLRYLRNVIDINFIGLTVAKETVLAG